MARSLKVLVPNMVSLIKLCPGFEKKKLASRKLDIVALCESGCTYCSSNWGNYLRINRQKFADLTEQQLGFRCYPDTQPALSFHYDDVIGQLEGELARRPRSFGRGETLVFSMQTDGFSPSLVKSGATKRALEILLERTEFRIRVLTKNAAVGSSEWIRFFLEKRERFAVGLSIGTLDDAWARRIEIGTSQPSARVRALHRLQDAGVPTYGMLCPVFPDVLNGQSLERLVDAVRPAHCEHVWAEPFNDRENWRSVQARYQPASSGYDWFTRAFGGEDDDGWSAYALELYKRLRAMAEPDGWLDDKLRFLLYEHDIADHHVREFGDLRGILLQSKARPDGRSSHSGFAALQASNGAIPGARRRA